MEKRTILLGVLLIFTGLAFFFWTGFEKKTALIPLPFGLLFLLFGYLAFSESKRKAVMHFASLLGLLGALPLFMGLPKVIALLQGEAVKRPLAAVEMSIMGLLCTVYFLSCVKYFVDRQKEKKTNQ